MKDTEKEKEGKGGLCNKNNKGQPRWSGASPQQGLLP